jgi:hypothetical protein
VSSFYKGTSESALPLAAPAVSLIEKETNERRTSNIERPTSNIVFCLFYKKTDQHALHSPRKRLAQRECLRCESESTLRNPVVQFSAVRRIKNRLSVALSILDPPEADSMFDVESVHCSS